MQRKSIRHILFDILSVALCVIPFLQLRAQEASPLKIADDIERKFTSVGNLGLTITNFGTIGTRNSQWPRQPSCEYPRGSRVEHIYQGALWVGALLKTSDPADDRNDQFLVSTGAHDLVRRSSGGQTVEGYEFTSERGDSIQELSSLSDDRPPESQFSPHAVSHQDFIADYTDRYTRVPQSGDSIVGHSPLGINVHQESYSWNFPFADFFVILRYVITNAGADTLDSVYVGLWDNAVVRNTNLVRPGTTGYFNYSAHGYDPRERMVYSFDFSGAPGGAPANSYVGIKLLGSSPFPADVSSIDSLSKQTFFSAWKFREATDAEFIEPTEDFRSSDPYLSRYSRMTQSLSPERIEQLRRAPVNAKYLLSTGPFRRLVPGDSLEVVFAVVCAKQFGTGYTRDTVAERRKLLYDHAAWAQQAYNGEDANGNNSLDAGEDIARRDSVSPSEFGLRFEPDGKITRYLLPTPPRRPKVRAVVENNGAVIYWDKASSEESIDPISGERDFEGYRIYRSETGSDFLNHEDFLINLSIVGEFDRSGNSIGYNTGLGNILLETPKTFPNDTVQYWYQFPPKNTEISHLNGWQYTYGISAFDRGDSANGVPSLESARVLKRLVPGVAPTSSESAEVFVYPNPYYGNAYWDGDRERLRKIYFANLPPKCQIRVYTLAGDVVTVLEHDAAESNGSDIEWFQQFGDRNTEAQFSGGEHAWDLITRHDQAIATGLYLFTVEDHATGTVKRGKFLVVK